MGKEPVKTDGASRADHSTRIGLVAVALAALLVVLGLYILNPLERFSVAAAPQVREPVTFGLARESLAALAMIARDRGYFADAGLDVSVKEYKSGQLALAGFLAGEAAIATTADIPIAFESLVRQDFGIVATIGSSDNEPRIIARKDAGIASPADLRGKRVATQRASAVHFFLHMFLLQNGMTADDVSVSFMKPDELVRALADGRIDAFSMREPYISQALKAVGESGVVFSQPGLYRKTFNVVASNELLKSRPQVARKVLNALLRAELYALEQPQEAMAIVAKGLGAPPAEVAELWADASLKVSLDQSLLISLEDEAKWIITNKFTHVGDAPSYLGLLHLDALKAVDPILVSVIH